LSYYIVDVDGTLTTSGDTANQPLIDYLNAEVMDNDAQIIIVSARLQDRLEETRAWLQEHGVAGVDAVHLNDFTDKSGPNVGLEFKRYKYGLLIEQYGLDEIEEVIDNDADVRAMAESLGLKAYTPDEAISDDDEQRATYAVPDYVQAAARKGLDWHEQGLSGDGLQPRTVREARELTENRITSDKLVRLAAWIRRHRQDWEGVPQNSNPDDKDFPQAGAVAGFLWGVDTTNKDAADRVLSWADKLIASEQTERFDMKETESRSVPIGEFRLADQDGQKVFSGYAALYGAPSAGLPFTEVISKGAFKRTLSRVANSERVVKFLHGHDESRMLASTASGRLTLTEDEIGLRVEAKLDPADPDAAAVISKLTHEAAAMGMSFGFTVPKGGDAWSNEQRTLNEVNLFEVSILSGHQPAYPATLGLSAVRKLAESRIGIDAERLLNTLETVKAGKSLNDDEVEVIDAVRSALAPKPAAIDPTIASARLLLAAMEGENL
jgi:HK97 family phage prohead protease